MHLLQQQVIKQLQDDLREYREYFKPSKVGFELVTDDGLPSLKLTNFRGQYKADWEDESCYVIINEKTVKLKSSTRLWAFDVQYISRPHMLVFPYMVVVDVHHTEVLSLSFKTSNYLRIGLATDFGTRCNFSWSIPKPLMREYRKVLYAFISQLKD